MFVKRYCTVCEKTYDFEIKSPDGLNRLVCPVCESQVGKESRDPRPKIEAERTEAKIGGVFARILRIAYLFFFVLSVVGIVAFFLKLYAVLYAVTAVVLVVYLIQLITGTTNFKLGVVLVPIGAVVSFLITRSIPGACLGVMIVFCLRHLIRDMIYRLILKLIGKASNL